MALSRRDFLKASSAVAAALGLRSLGFLTEEALAAEGTPTVVWLQAQGCTGCSVSLLNSIYYTTIDKLLLNTLDMQYNSTVMAGAGSTAVNAANAAYAKGGYILAVEGAIPTASNGQYCTVWPGMTALAAVQKFAAKASCVLAVGTCASFGGVSAAGANPTGAKSVQAVVGTSKPLINVAGCPIHPDWLVGTIAYILKNGRAPALDSRRRPADYFRNTIHSACPYRNNSPIPPSSGHGGGAACTACHGSGAPTGAARLGQTGCMYPLGCKGPTTRGDCPTRKWNSAAAGAYGVNWCISAGAPCSGCTEPTFPGTGALYTLAAAAASGGAGGTASCSQCHSDGRSGVLPAGHPSIGGSGTGGTTTGTVNCRQCHSNGSTRGTLPKGHPSITRRRREEDDD
ncbi:MAG: hydrogenase small subunit [Phycisphaerae bacterium]|jgi:NiFe hydrogenase small subunit HydA